jgi:hypothetical protein
VNVTFWSTVVVVPVGGVRSICKLVGFTVWTKVELLPLKFESLL